MEQDAAAEVAELGGTPSAMAGGVRWTATAEELWFALHHLRIPDNIRVRIARFEARDFATLEERLKRVPWHAYLSGSPEDVRVTTKKSRLYHSDAVAERVRRATDRPGERTGARLYVRVDHDKVIVSIDASGEPMHKRGWDRKTSPAPLRETLAAGCLRAAGFGDQEPIGDPLCGAGTFLFEAAAARCRLPHRREFAITKWPSLKNVEFPTFEAPQPSGFYFGSDRDLATVKTAKENGARLLPQAIWQVSDVRVAAVPEGAAVITNLPYGKRLPDGLRDALRAFGALIEERTDLGPVYAIDGSAKLESITGLQWEVVRKFDNRGLRVRLLRHVR
ncbi:MAG: putative N6-adenine-specific DNA methylase [Bradymonadia bacterium]